MTEESPSFPDDETTSQKPTRNVWNEPALDYLLRHRLALDLCTLVETSRGDGLSAKEASGVLGRAIQTTTNALRSLEKVGILRSEKKNRVRKYWPHPDVMFDTVLEVAKLNSKVPGYEPSSYPKGALIKNLDAQFSLDKGKSEVTVTSPIDVETPLGKLQLDYLFSRGNQAVGVGISRVTDAPSLLKLLGALVALSSSRMGSSLILVVVFDKGRYEVKVSALSKVLEPLFGPRISIIAVSATDLTMMNFEFAKTLSLKIRKASISRLTQP